MSPARIRQIDMRAAIKVQKAAKRLPTIKRSKDELQRCLAEFYAEGQPWHHHLEDWLDRLSNRFPEATRKEQARRALSRRWYAEESCMMATFNALRFPTDAELRWLLAEDIAGDAMASPWPIRGANAKFEDRVLRLSETGKQRYHLPS